MKCELEILTGDYGEPIPYFCPTCAAAGRGRPSHGWGEPCPIAIKQNDAYVAKLDAERMYYIRAGGGSSDIAETMRKIGNAFDSEGD